jgi:transmembrane sensor
MRGPERDRHREAFERWYRSSPAHAEAFDETSEGFEEADILRVGELGRARSLPGPKRRVVPLRYALGAVVAVAVLALIFLVGAYLPSSDPGEEATERYATAGEAREVQLPDGSRMTLTEESTAVVAFTGAERRIALERGAGRFSVAHEGRPFRVAAGRTEVLARGTVFEVSLASGQTRVSLIQGSVEVYYPAAPSADARRLVRRLHPGEQMVVGRPRQSELAGRPHPLPQSGAPAHAEAESMLQFDGTPLVEAVAEVNRHSRIRIRLADSSIGELRITGAFRADDAEAFAQSLVAAFSLHLERRRDGTLLLHASPLPGREA